MKTIEFRGEIFSVPDALELPSVPEGANGYQEMVIKEKISDLLASLYECKRYPGSMVPHIPGNDITIYRNKITGKMAVTSTVEVITGPFSEWPDYKKTILPAVLIENLEDLHAFTRNASWVSSYACNWSEFDLSDDWFQGSRIPPKRIRDLID